MRIRNRFNLKLVKRFWAIAKLYWFGDEKWRALSLLALIIVMLIAYTVLGLVLNNRRGSLITALAQQDPESFWGSLLIYFTVLVIYVPLFAGARYLIDLLGLYWRRWLTSHFLDQYFADRSYYQLTSHSEIDNPDQRIAQDIRGFTQASLSLVLILVSSVFEIFGFSVQLWLISSSLVIFLIIYALVGTLVTIGVFGRILVRLNFEQLRREADFRFGLVRVRESAEPIAFYQGEEQESDHLKQRFDRVFTTIQRLILWRELGLGSFTNAYQFLTFAVPFIVLAPMVFAGEMEVGQVDVARGAFFAIFTSLNVVVSQFQFLTEFGASIERVDSFARFLNISAPTGARGRPHKPERIDTVIDSQIALEHVTLETPNYERTLVRDLCLQVPSERGLLIVGASGCGKSSLLRAIAGLWDTGTGKIIRPPLKEMLFLPQRPYMILGTLREQLLYPSDRADLSDEDLAGILRKVNLPHLIERFGNLDADQNWTEVLSLGEQQRLAFARLLVNRPRYAILDEATSALDVDNEERLYQYLQNTQMTYISVGHRPTLRKYHHLVLELFENESWQLKPLEN